MKPGFLALLLVLGINTPWATANSLEKTVQETPAEKSPQESEPQDPPPQDSALENKAIEDKASTEQTTTNEALVNETTLTESPLKDSPLKAPPINDTSTTSQLETDEPNLSDSDSPVSDSDNSDSNNSDSHNLNSDDSNPDSLTATVTEPATSAAILDADQWRFLHQYTASYDIISDGDRLGRASRTLRKDDSGWKLEISTKLKKWLLTLRSNEFSRFRIVDNQLKTDEFYTSTKVSFKDPRIIRQNFDWENQLEQGSKNKRTWELPLDELLYDRMSHFVKLRADLLADSKDFIYTVSYKGSRKSYEYVASGNEILKTPMGNIETIRFDRVSGDDSSFSIWLSPDYNFFPIRIAQIEQDKPDVTLALTKLEFVQESTASEQ